jgi:hypothetical protein
MFPIAGARRSVYISMKIPTDVIDQLRCQAQGAGQENDPGFDADRAIVDRHAGGLGPEWSRRYNSTQSVDYQRMSLKIRRQRHV